MMLAEIKDLLGLLPPLCCFLLSVGMCFLVVNQLNAENYWLSLVALGGFYICTLVGSSELMSWVRK